MISLILIFLKSSAYLSLCYLTVLSCVCYRKFHAKILRLQIPHFVGNHSWSKRPHRASSLPWTACNRSCKATINIYHAKNENKSNKIASKFLLDGHVFLEVQLHVSPGSGSRSRFQRPVEWRQIKCHISAAFPIKYRKFMLSREWPI